MDLVEGWPVDYSDSKISFLLRDGNELVMFLNDPIVIKRELVRLKEGHEQILEYEQDQKFYRRGRSATSTSSSPGISSSTTSRKPRSTIDSRRRTFTGP